MRPARAQTPPPNPVLASIAPDRPAPGDALTLSGTDLGTASDTVGVTFTPNLTVRPTSQSGSTLQVVVPVGAKTGDVAVTVTRTLPDGTSITRTSNALPVMVIWKEFDATPLGETSPGGNWMKPPGDADDLYYVALKAGTSYQVQQFWRITHAGTSELVLEWTRTAGSILWDNIARNPTNGDFVAILGGLGRLWIKNMSTGQFLAIFQNANTTWRPTALAFDSAGNLIVAGDNPRSATPGGWQVGLWRFAPTDTIALDPGSPNALIPGGADNGWGWQGEIAVSGDGTIFAVDGDNYPGPAKLWQLPGRGGQAYEAIPLPASPFHFPGYGYWYLTADCQHEAYLENPCLLDDSCTTPVAIMRASDLAPIGVLHNDGNEFGAFTSDAFMNFYYTTISVAAPTRGRRVIRRVLPSELSPGFYGVTAAPLAFFEDASIDSARTRGTPPPPPRDCGNVKVPPAICSATPPTPAAPLTATPRPSHPDASPSASALQQAPNAPAISEARRRELIRALEQQVRTSSAAAVSCSFGERGHLAVALLPDADLPDQVTTLSPDATGHASATVLLGQAPLMRAWWVPENPVIHPTLEEVRWEIVPGSERVINAAPKSLYADRPEIVFDEGDPLLTGNHLQFQTVHLGWFEVKLTSTKHGDWRPLTLDLNIDVPHGLGAAPGDFDAEIINVANRYGIPPQIIKSQVDLESIHKFDPKSYRYEPKTWDAERLTSWDWSAYGYDSYRMPSGSLLSYDDIRRREYYQIFDSYFPATPPQLPCCTRLLIATDQPTVWSIYEANDGWPGYPLCSYPWKLYHPSGVYPDGTCNPTMAQVRPLGPADDRRENWWTDKFTFMQHTMKFYCGTGPQAAECATLIGTGGVWLADPGGGRSWPAQTPIAASYGLMQMMYPTAVGDMMWNEGLGPESRHPTALFVVPTNLDLGAGYDAKNIFKFAFDSTSSPTFSSLAEYLAKLTDGIQKYNKDKAGYGDTVVFGNQVLGFPGPAAFKPH